MKAAVVLRAGSLPVYADFNEPAPAPGEHRIAVTAAALSPVVKGRVSGTHYSAPGDFPFVAGIDGVGRTDDGRRVYFILPRAPYGSMAEIAAVPASQCVPLPDGVDDITAAAIANPGLSSWAALQGTRQTGCGRNRADQRRDRNVRASRGSDRKAPRREESHCHGPQRPALQALKTLGADETMTLGEDTDALDAGFKKHFAGRSTSCSIISGAGVPSAC